MHNAKTGDRVRIKCSRLPDSDPSVKKPRTARTFEFHVGSCEVTPGLSKGVTGMAPGERKRLTLAPRDAYGFVQPCLIREIPRRRTSQRIEVRIGQWLKHSDRLSGVQERLRVVEITDDMLIVDGNHPLAGKTIELDVMLISVDSSANANKTHRQFEMGGES
jgi:FKBP-type peptidyl-prolyl cis-trans isomerase 2